MTTISGGAVSLRRKRNLKMQSMNQSIEDAKWDGLLCCGYFPANLPLIRDISFDTSEGHYISKRAYKSWSELTR